MQTSNLYQHALKDPCKNSQHVLYAVSGYASPWFIYKHIKSLPGGTSVRLIIGMSATEGISKQNHAMFVEMATVKFRGLFSCHYLTKAPSVHSKAYAWYNGTTPVVGFIGSPNYTDNGFGGNREILVSHDPIEIKNYYDTLLVDAVDCTSADIDSKICLTARPARLVKRKPKKGDIPVPEDASIPDDLPGVDTINTTLLMARGDIHNKSGLNWGQRDGRDPNQAYLPISASVSKSGFFPAKGKRFTVVTDDGVSFEAVVAQQGDKAIETPDDNSIIGRYIRKRIGLKSGAFVKASDLTNYGRTDVTWTKYKDDLYLLDFSVS